MHQPRVSVICLCYNQGRFVKEAIESAINQTYSNVEVIVVDDASTDNSVEVIQECISVYPQVQFIPLSGNHGNCRAFNKGLMKATGEFVIDLAADDILLIDRVEVGVRDLEAAGAKWGVHFSDALWISEEGEVLRKHSDRFPHNSIPQGDVYRDLVRRFFICSPTMMFRMEVIRALRGYDEALSYEDFDFWIRSSREYCYLYSSEVLVKKRVVKNSMSERQFTFFSRQLMSTFRVCEKILSLNRTVAEKQALTGRILYEMRVCVRLLRFTLLLKYARLLFCNYRMRY